MTLLWRVNCSIIATCKFRCLSVLEVGCLVIDLSAWINCGNFFVSLPFQGNFLTFCPCDIASTEPLRENVICVPPPRHLFSHLSTSPVG